VQLTVNKHFQILQDFFKNPNPRHKETPISEGFEPRNFDYYKVVSAGFSGTSDPPAVIHPPLWPQSPPDFFFPANLSPRMTRRDLR